jgi:hypothetical protein
MAERTIPAWRIPRYLWVVSLIFHHQFMVADFAQETSWHEEVRQEDYEKANQSAK